MSRSLLGVVLCCALFGACNKLAVFPDKSPEDTDVDAPDDGVDISEGVDTDADPVVDIDADPDPDPSDITDPATDDGLDSIEDTSPDTETEPEADAPPLVPVFVTISPVPFTMGSPTSETGRETDEVEHDVTLSRSFEMMAYELTQGQFEDLMTYNRAYFSSCGRDCAMEFVNWHEAAAYANALSTEVGYDLCYSCTGSGTTVSCSPNTVYATPYDCPGYRLPTEAEWEFAARAGTTDATYNGNMTLTECETPNTVMDPIAWFCGNSAVSYSGCFDLSGDGGPSCAGTNLVGDKTANAFGLYDMLGNVWEWTNDWSAPYTGDITDPWGPSTGTGKIQRGGSWRHPAWRARAANRSFNGPALRLNYLGFRLVRTLP